MPHSLMPAIQSKYLLDCLLAARLEDFNDTQIVEFIESETLTSLSTDQDYAMRKFLRVQRSLTSRPKNS